MVVLGESVGFARPFRRLLAVLLVLLFAGCATTEKQEEAPAAAAVDPAAQAAFDTALQAMADGRDAEALPVLLRLTRDFPQYSGPFANLGIVHFRAGRLEQAKAAFEQAIAINPGSAVSYDYLGIIEREAGRFKQAEENYRKAIAADARYAPAHRNYGILLELYMGRPKEALAQYETYQKLTGDADKQVAKWIIDLRRRTGAKP